MRGLMARPGRGYAPPPHGYVVRRTKVVQRIAYIGLDLGQAADYTAMAVLSVLPAAGGEDIPLRERKLECPMLSRFPLRTPYPRIVEDVAELHKKLSLTMGEVHLIIDGTGVGRPVSDLFTDAGLPHVAVCITGGHEVTPGDGPGAVNVPKRDLISSLQVAMHSGNMRIAKGLSFAATLKRELEMFRIKVSIRGAVSLEAWRESDHDDLVLALALASWAATYSQFPRYAPGESGPSFVY